MYHSHPRYGRHAAPVKWLDRNVSGRPTTHRPIRSALSAWRRDRADKALATLEARRELRQKLNTLALAESMRARLEVLGPHRVLGGLTKDQGDTRKARNAAKRARRAWRARGGQAGR